MFRRRRTLKGILMTDINLKEEFEKLIKLQVIDSEIFDLNVDKNEIPVRIKNVNLAMENKKLSMDAINDELKKLKVARDNKENDMAANEEKIKKHESSLAQIKTNKEYTAMLEQISGIKADVSLLEEKIIGDLDRIEKVEKSLDEERKKFEEEKDKGTKEIDSINEVEKRITARLNDLEISKREIIKGINEELLKKYEKILNIRGRNALSNIDGEFCGECNLKLRPQVIDRAKICREIVMCDNCSRILISPA